jgi:NADH dehydrogenase [ubiquinone] 1 alpha subcomplex assembly factor 7
MNNNLFLILKKIIEAKGAIDMGAFMELCLGHPEHGYYMNCKPFGVKGDFTTAPEISQLFGEMIGIFFTQLYEQMGKPERIHLIECGAGRGTMMRDMLRVISPRLPVMPHIIEFSEQLRAEQKQTIKRNDVIWHDDYSTLPTDAPLLIVGNEFLDALPTRQAIAYDNAWYEHCVLMIDQKLSFVRGQKLDAKNLPSADKDGRIFEFSPIRESIHVALCEKILKQKGALLWIDYGFETGNNCASIQALRNHKYVSILEDVGRADISSLVDFEALVDVTPRGLTVGGIISQAEFLKGCGIDLRLQTLCEKNPKDKQTLEQGYHRLMNTKEMGQLFKVLGVVKL